jgi:hypothetical protein
MPKYRNISGGDLDISIPGVEQNMVADGDVIEIPEFQPDGVSPIAVPLNRWELVPEPKVAPEKKKSAASSEAAV